MGIESQSVGVHARHNPRYSLAAELLKRIPEGDVQEFSREPTSTRARNVHEHVRTVEVFIENPGDEFTVLLESNRLPPSGRPASTGSFTDPQANAFGIADDALQITPPRSNT